MRQKQVSPPLDPSDFVGSEVQQQLQRWDQLRPPAVHVPVCCVWITRTSTQAVLFAQLAYWFSPTRKVINRNYGLLDQQRLKRTDLIREYLEFRASDRPIWTGRDAGVVFRIVHQGWYVLHNWRDAELLKQSTASRVTIPLVHPTFREHLYLEPFASLLEDIGDDWL